MHQLLFKLNQDPNGRGLRCDGNGLFFGGDPLLERDEEGRFEARTDGELRKTFGIVCGDDTNWDSRIRSVKLVAKALNNGDMARAMMTAVLMRLPDPGSSIRITDVDGALAKAGYDPDEPRDDRGRWTNGGSGDSATAATSTSFASAHRDPRIQLAGDFRSDVSDDPVAEAVRAAAAAQRNSRGIHSQTKPAASGLEHFWQTIGSNLLHGADSAFSEVGHAEVINSRGNLAADAMETHAVARAFGAYTGLMEYHTGGTMPITPETPIWGYGANARLAPDRPIELGDYVNPVVTASAIVPVDEIFVGATQASRLIESESRTYIILPKELSKDFDIRLPVGRYEIPKNAVPGTTTYGDQVGKQIGNLVQDRLPGIPVILRTSPGMKGVDIELAKIDVPELGARYIEVKPLTNSGFKTFRVQVARWKLEEPVLPVSYDYEGNFYYGFPK